MNLSAYTISNGYTGCGPVDVVILAETIEDALKEAERHFKKDAVPNRHTDRYWKNLKVDEIITIQTIPAVVGGCDG